LYFVTRETVDPAATLHARMFFYNGEDPAAGSAGGCTAAWMVMHGVAPPDRRVQIEQGIEMRRPSRIFVRASFHENHHENLHTNRDDNRIVNVRVGGHAVEVLRGEVFPNASCASCGKHYRAALDRKFMARLVPLASAALYSCGISR
jgi:trans-2,3-dihydro-3-hydroxyanthranilate isomerase